LGSLREIQRTKSDESESNVVPTSGYQPGQLIARYDIAELIQKTSSFRLQEAHSYNPIRDEVYEDVKVYALGGDHYLIKGIARDYAITGISEVSLEQVEESEIKEVTRKKWILFGPRVKVKKLKRSGWIALKETREVEMEVRGTLLLGR